MRQRTLPDTERVQPPAWWSHEQRGDFLFGAAILALAMFELSVFPALSEGAAFTPTKPTDGWLLALTIVAIAPIAVRRRWAIVAMGISHLAWTLIITFDYAPASTTQFALFITFYSVALYSSRTGADSARGVLLTAILAWMTVGVVQTDLPWALVPIAAAAYALTWGLGNSARNRYDAQLLFQQRAERAERDRTAGVARAVEEERARIARELHDVVAHSLTVMTVQAAGARRVLESDPGRVTAALETIEQTGRQAMQEMRRMIGVMRDSHQGANRAPRPGVEAIPGLIQQIERAGLTVSCSIDPIPGDLPPGVDLTVYRIVQEALTNTIKHGGPGVRAKVEIATRHDALEITVRDDGRGAAAGSNEAGLGLVGMRERVGIYGGDLKAAPRQGGGFEVRARIPTGAAT